MEEGMTPLDWIAMTACLTWTVVMLIHVGQLGRAFRDDDDLLLRALLRHTMRLVGIWQIVLGLAMFTIGWGREGHSLMPTITLVGSGLGILLLDWIKRKFDRAVTNHVQTDIT
jgi:hypothetical protein